MVVRVSVVSRSICRGVNSVFMEGDGVKVKGLV